MARYINPKEEGVVEWLKRNGERVFYKPDIDLIPTGKVLAGLVTGKSHEAIRIFDSQEEVEDFSTLNVLWYLVSWRRARRMVIDTGDKTGVKK